MFIFGSIILVIIDQITKYFVVEYIPLSSEIPLINGILSLGYVQNKGAAWGIFADKSWLLTIFIGMVIVFITFFLIKKRIEHNLLRTSIMLIYAGAIGNFLDRIFRGGAVVDMIVLKFINYPVFNFADCCIVVGAVLMCIYVLFFTNDKEKNVG